MKNIFYYLDIVITVLVAFFVVFLPCILISMASSPEMKFFELFCSFIIDFVILGCYYSAVLYDYEKK